MSLNCDLDDRETHRDLFACPWGYFPPEHPWSDHEARGVKCGVASSLVFWMGAFGKLEAGAEGSGWLLKMLDDMLEFIAIDSLLPDHLACRCSRRAR
jgi:hypothetical protein